MRLELNGTAHFTTGVTPRNITDTAFYSPRGLGGSNLGDQRLCGRENVEVFAPKLKLLLSEHILIDASITHHPILRFNGARERLGKKVGIYYTE
jgi:hypothetical protein